MAQAFRFGPNGIALQFSAKADVEVNVVLCRPRDETDRVLHFVHPVL
jgi:hypothetical protein